jgi:hypothetical protein
MEQNDKEQTALGALKQPGEDDGCGGKTQEQDEDRRAE